MAGALEDAAREQGRDLYLKKQFQVSITRSESKGRCLITNRSFRAGEIVLASEPYAYLLFPALEQERCHECFSRRPDGKPLLRCAACKAARYCSVECQKRAWKRHHRSECALEGALGEACRELPEVARQDLRLLARVALLNISAPAPALPDPDNFTPDLEQCLMMACHEAALEKEDPQRMEGNKMLAALVLEVLERGRRSGALKPSLAWNRLPTHGQLVSLLVALACNDFTIWDELLVAAGFGIYPLGAILNHSCQPNCVLYYEAHTHRQIIRCIRDVPSGEELCHAYIDIAAPSPQRQARLRESYFFDCRCPRCLLPPAELDLRLRAEGAGEAALEPEVERAGQVVESSADPAEVREACVTLRGAEEEWALRRDALDLQLLALRSKLLQGWILVGDAAAAIRTCDALVAAYREIYPPNHPLTGLQLYTLGNLEVDSEGRSGKRHLLEARDILTISHGKYSKMVAGLEELLRGAQ